MTRKNDDEAPRPKTRPTGRPPADARRKAAGPSTTHVLEVELVKRAYTFFRGRWETKKTEADVHYRPPKKYDGRLPKLVDGEPAEGEKATATKNVWAGLLAWCRARDVQAQTYIAFTFDTLPLIAYRAPEPHQLSGDNQYYAKWCAEKGKIRERVAESLTLEKQLARAMIESFQRDDMTYPNACASVILDRGIELSPLMRFCLARAIADERPEYKVRFRKISRRFEAEAILQFQTYRAAYRSVWRAMLPEGFSARAKRIYPHLLVD